MPELVNLEKIVNYVYESELELEPEETRESKRNSCYENVRSQLTLILKNIEFDVDLIKDMEHGYANKGSFVIPKKDGLPDILLSISLRRSLCLCHHQSLSNSVIPAGLCSECWQTRLPVHSSTLFR